MKIGRGYVATKDQKAALAKLAGLAERDVRSADIPSEVIANLRFRKGEGVAVSGLEVFAVGCKTVHSAVKAIAAAVEHVQSFGADVVEVPSMKCAGQGVALLRAALRRMWADKRGMTLGRALVIGKKGGRPTINPVEIDMVAALTIWADPNIKSADLAAAKIGMPRSSAFSKLGRRQDAVENLKKAIMAARQSRRKAK